jgi:hypothetical protein
MNWTESVTRTVEIRLRMKIWLTVVMRRDTLEDLKCRPDDNIKTDVNEVV